MTERPGTRELLELAHRLESRAGGGLALALACGRGLSRARLTEWRDALLQAAAALETILGEARK